MHHSLLNMDSVKTILYSCDHPGFLELTQETWQNRWFPSQIQLATDSVEIKMLSDTDKEFYRFLFTFLGMAERLVNFNVEEIIGQFSSHDLYNYYVEQMAMENIHGKVYANILSMFFGNSNSEMYEYANKIINDNALLRKINWLQERVKSATSTAEKVLMFLLIEGIFFVSSFYSIGLLRVRGIMSGVCLANDYISRDEYLHTRAAALLYTSLVPVNSRPSTKWIQDLFMEAVQIEHEFVVAKSQGVSLISTDDIKDFLEATADRILKTIDCVPIYGTFPPRACPLSYIGYIKNVNFFERESSDYTTSVNNDL